MPDPARPIPQLLTPAEAARALRVSVKSLLAEVRAGRLRYVLIGRRRRFTPADLEAYIAERRIDPCLSSAAQGRPTGGTTSPRKVIGFAAARARLTRPPR